MSSSPRKGRTGRCNTPSCGSRFRHSWPGWRWSLDFFASKKGQLATSVGDAVSGFEADGVSRWLREFFGLSARVEYHLVFAPAMFRGGYAAQRIQGDALMCFMVLCERGYSTAEPTFSSGNDLARLALHEFGHSFVNPAVDANLATARSHGIEDLYKPVEKQMTAQAYGQFAVFLCEQLLRATVILGSESALGDTHQAQRIATEETQGFYLTNFTVQALEFYQQNRSTYPTFASFVPKLLEEYRDHKAELLKLAPGR